MNVIDIETTTTCRCGADLTKKGAIVAYTDGRYNLEACVRDGKVVAFDTADPDLSDWTDTECYCASCGDITSHDVSEVVDDPDEPLTVLFNTMVEARYNAERFDYWGENDMEAVRNAVEAYLGHRGLSVRLVVNNKKEAS